MRSALKYILFCTLFTFSCGESLPTQNQGQALSLAKKPQLTRRKPTSPYTGPVKISFSSEVVSPVLASYGFRPLKGVDVPFILGSEKGFRTQAGALPSLFNENFQVINENFQAERTFTALNTQQSYTLELVSDTALPEGVEIEVIVNGFPWLKTKDIKNSVFSLTKSGILLQISNQVEIKIKGDFRGDVNLKISEAGSAGVIRGNQPPSTRDYSGPFYDPTNPLTLGALKPLLQIPETADGLFIPSVSLNGGIGSSFSAGEFQVKVKAPVEANLSQILLRYAGSVTSELENNEFGLFLDISKADLKALPANLQELNSLLDGESAIRTVTFDSLQGAQNFALMVELLLAAQRGDWIEALDVNPVLANNSIQTYEGRSTNNNLSMNAQDSWWLKETGVLDAWKYTMGYQRQNNRPVKIAVVDSSFKYLDDVKKLGQDMQGQILTTRFAEVGFEKFPQQRGNGAYYSRVLTQNGQDDFLNNLAGQNTDGSGKTAHGTSQASTIASNINDRVGIAGIAPHAKIIPIKIGKKFNNSSDIVMGWDLRVALQAAGVLQADVVSITYSTIVNDVDNWLEKVNQVTTNSPYGWLSSLQYQVDVLELPKGTTPQSNRVICVFNAGNAGNHVRNTLPAGKLKNIVIAGAISKKSEGTYIRALFRDEDTEDLLFNENNSSNPDYNNLNYNQEAASSWWTGSNSPGTGNNTSLFLDISQWESVIGNYSLKLWAPGQEMGAQGTTEKQDGTRELAVIENWGGTSAATPFTAATLALLKSIHPDATVKSILAQNSIKSKAIQTQDNLLKDFYDGGGKRRGFRLDSFALTLSVIDVGETIQSHAFAQNLNNQSRTFTGILQKDLNNRPYLKNGDKEIDLSMFVEEPEFHTDSTLAANKGPRLRELSDLLKQDHYQVFWNQTAFDITGNSSTHNALINKPIEITGWLYEANEETDHPLNIEVSELSREIRAENIIPWDPGGFSVLGVSGIPQPNQVPTNTYLYDKVGNRWLVEGQTLNVNLNDFVGIQFNQPIRALEVKIGPVMVPIVDVIENLAVIGIPDDLPAGVHDAIIEASGQTLTLKDVVNKAAQQSVSYTEPSETPPSISPGQDKNIQIFNISEGDQARVYLNNALIATVNGGENESINLGPYSDKPLRTDQRNELRFELQNNGGNGYTYGFEVHMNNSVVFKDIQGNADSHWVKNSANETDTSEGIVYKERIWLHNTGILPVGAGDFWLKVSNMDDDEELKVVANNQTGDIQWSNDEFLVKPQFQTFYKQLPWSSEICVAGTDCWCESYSNYCWSSNYLSYELFNQSGGYSHNIEVYKGMYLIYRSRDGQKSNWGASNNRQETSNPWSVESNWVTFWKFGIKPQESN